MKDGKQRKQKQQLKYAEKRKKYQNQTSEEKEKTRKIKEIMSSAEISGKPPFAFEYTVPMLHFEGESRFSSRIIYAFSGLYQHAFDIDSEWFLPDEQLNAYRALGINGILEHVGGIHIFSHRLFAVRIHARVDGVRRMLGVLEVGGGDDHRIDILRLLVKFDVAAVGFDSMAQLLFEIGLGVFVEALLPKVGNGDQIEVELLLRSHERKRRERDRWRRER